jgi:alpha-ketoglutarate-dependent taurine dioxygenase
MHCHKGQDTHSGGLLRPREAASPSYAVPPGKNCEWHSFAGATLNHSAARALSWHECVREMDMTVQGRAAPWLVEAGADASAEAAFDIVRDHRESLGTRLRSSGALLFRGFALGDVVSLARFVEVFSDGAPPFGYAGGASPRTALDGAGVYSSTEYPADIELSLHNELSYVDVFPNHLFFCCITAPDHGGATTLGDSRRILAGINRQVVDTFRAKGIRYVRNLSADAGTGYSWQDAFETGYRAEAEAACRRLGASFEWLADGYLRVSQLRPATALHPRTGEEVWFNQADGFHPSALDADTYAALLAWHGSEDRFRLTVSFGNGTPIPRAMLDEVRRAIAAERVEHQWQLGDIVVLDNFLMAHGRAPFSGARKIALAMT